MYLKPIKIIILSLFLRNSSVYADTKECDTNSSYQDCYNILPDGFKNKVYWKWMGYTIKIDQELVNKNQLELVLPDGDSYIATVNTVGGGIDDSNLQESGIAVLVKNYQYLVTLLFQNSLDYGMTYGTCVNEMCTFCFDDYNYCGNIFVKILKSPLLIDITQISPWVVKESLQDH